MRNLYIRLATALFFLITEVGLSATHDDSAVESEALIPLALLELSTSSDLVLIGEVHGTKQIPVLLSKLVQSIAEQGKSISLGLEVLDELSPHFDDFIDTDCSDHSTSGFLELEWWNPRKQDGRRSRAFLDLLVNLRILKNRYPGKIHVYFYNAFSREYSEREALMANNVYEEVQSSKADVNVVLSGRIHTGTKKGLPYDLHTKSMGEHLVSMLPTTKSVLLTYSGGKRWACSTDYCGASSVPAMLVSNKSSVNQIGVLMDENLRHDFFWHIGVVDASPPANLD